MTDYHKLNIFFTLLLLVSTSTYSKDVVKVGLAHFPPYIEAREAQVTGLAIDMLNLMNQHQDTYKFVPVRTTAVTRHREFSAGRHDMSLFDNLSWGWNKFEVEASDEFLDGAEVYIARAKPGRDESYFSDFKNKRMIGMLGYHYAFADFNSDPEYLRKTFRMELTQSNRGSIKMVLADNRGDIAVVTKAFLSKYLNESPEDRPKLLISKKLDQEYHFVSIIRKGIKPTVKELNNLIQQLENNGSLPNLWKKINQ